VPAVTKLAAWARNPMVGGKVVVVVGAEVGESTVVLVVGLEPMVVGATTVVVVVVVMGGAALGDGLEQPARASATTAAEARARRRTHAPCGSAS
jgi:hypothetical protein